MSRFVRYEKSFGMSLKSPATHGFSFSGNKAEVEGSIRVRDLLDPPDSQSPRRGIMSTSASTVPSPIVVKTIREKARRLGILSLMSTTVAGSGHPTSCLSAAELAASCFFMP